MQDAMDKGCRQSGGRFSYPGYKSRVKNPCEGPEYAVAGAAGAIGQIQEKYDYGNHLCRAHKTENIKQRTTRNIVVVNRHRSPAGPLNNLISCPPLTFEKILWKTISPGSHRCQGSIFQKDNVVLLSCALMRRPPGVADANLLACKWDASIIVRHAESYLQD